MPTGSNMSMIVLRSGGCAVLLDLHGAGLPRVAHWGADVDLPEMSLSAVVAALEPGVPSGTQDEPLAVTVLPGAADGWPGRPTVRGHRPEPGSPGAAAFPRWTVTSAEVTATSAGWVAEDADNGLELTGRMALEASGVLTVDVTLRNGGSGPYLLDGITPVLPVPLARGSCSTSPGAGAGSTRPSGRR